MNKPKRGRPSQNKHIRHYTLDEEVTDYIDSLPDGDRSKFVNNWLKQHPEIKRRGEKTTMFFIPDYSNMPSMSREEYAIIKAEIDAEIAASKAVRLNEDETEIWYPGATAWIDTYIYQQALDDFNATPSYVERFARGEETF
jgi:hypothetical protein